MNSGGVGYPACPILSKMSSGTGIWPISGDMGQAAHMPHWSAWVRFLSLTPDSNSMQIQTLGTVVMAPVMGLQPTMGDPH